MKIFNLIRICLLYPIVVCGLSLTSQANGTESMAKLSSSGFYRLQLGEFEVTALSDGTVDLPMDKLLQQDADKTKAQLAGVFLATPTETSVNGYLINTGEKLVLVDTGAGSLFGPTLGNIVISLRAAGYKPSDVDHILLTHLHPDHVGGLAQDGERVFSSAMIHADQRDLDYWLSEAEMNKAPEENKGFFQGAMASLNPYVNAQKVVAFDGSQQILPGIKANATHGHTPGHTSYLLESDGQAMWVIGDLIHAAAIQFAYPEVTIDFDASPELALAQRSRIFGQAANSKAMIAGAHLPFPGLGHLVKLQNGFKWIPANYQRLRSKR